MLDNQASEVLGTRTNGMFIWATTNKMNQLQPFSGFVSLICRLNSLEKRDGLAWLGAPASASLGASLRWTGLVRGMVRGFVPEESLGTGTRRMGSGWWMGKNNRCTVWAFKPQCMAPPHPAPHPAPCAKRLLTLGQKQMLSQ